MSQRTMVVNVFVIATILASGWLAPAAALSVPARDVVPTAQRLGPPGFTVSLPIKQDLSPVLREIPPVPPSEGPIQREMPHMPLPRAGSKVAPSKGSSAPVQNWLGKLNMPAPIQNWEGVNNVNGVLPPDTQGDVGPNHYIQWVNLSFAIWNKSGTLLYGPANGNTLWTGFGGACETTNDGDPITLYDPLADRWFMSQFALPNYPNGPFYQCIAVSQTPDPTGAWYRYAYQVPVNKMNDYPKFGVWPDAYYMTVNQFNAGTLTWGGAGVAAFERSQMLVGAAAQMIYIDVGAVTTAYGGMLPSDLDGPPYGLQPPAGSPNYFAEWDDSAWIGPNDALRIWAFHVDWANPANSTFGLNANHDPNFVINTDNVDPDMCGYARSCIPQPGTTQGLDAISDRLMYRLQYRNFGGYQTLVSNHTVDVGGDHAGIHWFELRDTGAGWTMYQQGVYAPDSEHRWMGSVAMDHSGNIALGYSVSSSSVYPSIRYDGRLAGDPLGILPQGETAIITGTGSQTHSAGRWGDYSTMSVDPVDDCTFWYTQEYIQTTGSAPWRTRIASFKFPSCSIGATGTLTGVVSNASTGMPIVGASIQAQGQLITHTSGTTSGAGGVYSMILPVDTYTVTGSAYGYLPTEIGGVSVTSGTTTTQNIALTPAPMYVVSGTVTDANTGWPLYARLTVVGYPGNPIWNDPVSGYYSITLQGNMTYTFQVNAWVAGYLQGTRDVFVAGNQTENFALNADMATCNAPGYSLSGGLSEPFNATTVPPGWTVIDNAGTGAVWRFDNPGGRTNWTGGTGNFAIADSDDAGFVNMDTELRTPALDFTGWASVILEFKYDFFQNASEVADVDVSINGAAGPWTNVWTRSGASDRGPKTATIDISAIAANQPNVMIRFHYYNANYEWWWEVDDVRVGPPTCVAPTNGGLVVGNVYDANTNAALTGATVSNDSGRSFVAASTVDPAVDDAFYTLFSPSGNHIFTATMTGGYGADVETINVLNFDTVEQNFNVPAGRLSYAPPVLEATILQGYSTTVPFTLTNTGGRAATFELHELDKGFGPLGPFQQPDFVVKPFKQGLPTAQGLGLPPAPPAPPYAAGDVIQSWTPTGVGADAWSVAYDSNNASVWVGDGWGATNNIVEHQPNGTPTGRVWPYAWPTVGSNGPADAAFNWNTGMVWIMNVNSGVANCIYEIDPAAGYTGNYICPGGGTGFATSQRGLTYDPATDTYLAGGWNDLMIYRFNSAGTILQQVNTGLAIAGLAYNADTQHLFVMVNDSPNPVYVLDAANNFAPIGQFNVSQGFTANAGAGMEFDCNGNLWAVDQNTNTVYQFESGETTTMCARDVPWLSESPITGTVPALSDQVINVTFDAGVITQTGKYYAQLKLQHDTPYLVANAPVTMTVVSAPTCGFTSSSPDDLGETTYFTNTTTGTPPISYTWNWGDGSPLSSAISPTHQYTQVGFYTVVLTATNPWSQDVCTGTVSIEGPPEASFISNSPVFYGNPVVFTNTTLANPWVTTWQWVFGDPASGGANFSTTQNPSHNYTGPGMYTVTLTAMNAKGIDIYTDTVTVQPLDLTVNVVGNGTVGRNPLPPYIFGQVVTLTATPDPGWTFVGWSGDLVTTTNPVQITMDSPKVVTATFILACVPVSGVDWTFTPTVPKVGETVIFTGTVLAGTAPITFTWTFGDGGVGSGAVVTHVFPLTNTVRTYTVTLAAANVCTSPAVEVSEAITVYPRRLYLPVVLKNP